MRPLIYFTVTWWIVRICGEGGVEALSNGLWGGEGERENGGDMMGRNERETDLFVLLVKVVDVLV